MQLTAELFVVVILATIILAVIREILNRHER
jgi:hypothetical protein